MSARTEIHVIRQPDQTAEPADCSALAPDASGNGFDGGYGDPNPTFIAGHVTGDTAANVTVSYGGNPQIIPDDGVPGPTFQNHTQPGYDPSHSIEIWGAIPASGTDAADRVAFYNEGSGISGDYWERVLILTDGGIDWDWRGHGVGGSNAIQAPAGSFPNDGLPHHLVLTHQYVSFATATSVANFYVDGALADSQLVFGEDQVISWWQIVAGGPSGRSSDPVYWDEFALYDHVVSAARVAAHYAARTNFATYTAAVLADAPSVYWHFNCTPI